MLHKDVQFIEQVTFEQVKALTMESVDFGSFEKQFVGEVIA